MDEGDNASSDTKFLYKTLNILRMNTQLKSKMMQLWSDTFHDSDEYISLVFASYFDDNAVEVELEGDDLRSAMLSVGYEFRPKSGGRTLHGLYLCGLATKPEARGAGLMSTLMQRIEDRAREEGFDFTFLIPADAGLRRFYADRGYADSFWRLPVRFAPGHRFSTPDTPLRVGVLQRSTPDFDSVAKDLAEKLASIVGGSAANKATEEMLSDTPRRRKRCCGQCGCPIARGEEIDPFFDETPLDSFARESANKSDILHYNIRHSAQDWTAVLEDLRLSDALFLWLEREDRVVAYCYASRPEKSILTANECKTCTRHSRDRVSKITVNTDKITDSGKMESAVDGVSLTGDVRVKRVYAEGDDLSLMGALLQKVQELFPDSDLVLSLPQRQATLFGGGGVEEDFYPRTTLERTGYEAMSTVSLPSGVSRRLESYAMVKFLDAREILKKLGNGAREKKYSILSDLEKSTKMGYSGANNALALGKSAEFAAMLGRKRTKDDYVGLATDLPLLDLDAYLLLED